MLRDILVFLGESREELPLLDEKAIIGRESLLC